MKALSYIILIGIIVLLYSVMWNPGESETRVLEDQGLTEVHVDTLSFFGCPDDQYGYKFEATNQGGKNVKGVMCKNGVFFGSWNIRYF